MGLTPEPVKILREQKQRDDAGGWKVTLAQVGTGDATLNNYRRVSYDRLEQGTHTAQGPGVATSRKRFFTFERPEPYTASWPDVRINDVIEAADGSRWTVHEVRPYEETMQIDVEAVL